MADFDLFLFVSHVSEDRAAALEIVDELERRGVPCWIAPRNVEPGKPFDDEIADALDRCRAMLLIFSERCNESEYIRREITVAGESHKIIIPFRIEDVQPRRGLRVRLSDLHWIDAFVSRERAIDELAKRFAPSAAEKEQRDRHEADQREREEEERQREEAREAEAARQAEGERQRQDAQRRVIEDEARRAEEARKTEEAAREAESRRKSAEARRPPEPVPRAGGPLGRKSLVIGIGSALAVLVAILGLTVFGVFRTSPSHLASTVPAPARPAPTQTETAPAVQAAPQPAPTSPHAAGQGFRDCPDCPEMVVVPPGQFMMGSDASDADSYSNERPRHAVAVKTAFAVGKYDVLRAEYTKFVQAGGWGGHALPAGCPNFAQTDRDPVTCVSWDDARAYVAWLSGTTGKGYRLLSEAEWEYAARAETTTVRYWGDAIGSGHANCNGCGSRWDNKSTSPAGSFAPNPFGLYDMLGNAWQWVEDCYHDSYAGAPSDAAARDSGDCPFRVGRGGDWTVVPPFIRAANRSLFSPDKRYDYIGFRLARTITP